MTQPMGLLSGLIEIQNIMQSDGCSYEVAHQRWLELQDEPKDNVVWIDFRVRNTSDLDSGDAA